MSDVTPVEINMGGRAHGRLVLAVLVPSLLGVVALAAFVRGMFSGGRGEWLVGSVVVLALVVVAPRLIYRVTEHFARPRTLVIGPDGVRWNEPRGTSWAVGWDEVAGVAVIGARSGAPVLELVAHKGFRDPSLTGDRYRRPLPDTGFTTTVDLALRRFAGDRYEGLR
ncbi:hypothetical protein [Saccharothrix variisporea]|uniref:hypothetical protein n=1 Tax=Saccharothrix variisporea TaxID=543527 RepID=UPI000EAD006F|nr:hypothetical protein [Saccharothrix variisporea]